MYALASLEVDTIPEGRIVPPPNFVVRDKDGITQVIYFLESYLRDSASGFAWRFFHGMVKNLERFTRGRAVRKRFCLNPFCESNHAECIAEKPYVLDDFRIKLNETEKAAIGAETKKKQAAAGKKSALMRMAKSIEVICEAIRELKSRGEPVTQGRVAELAGRNRATVIRLWREEPIQNERVVPR